MTDLTAQIIQDLTVLKVQMRFLMAINIVFGSTVILPIIREFVKRAIKKIFNGNGG